MVATPYKWTIKGVTAKRQPFQVSGTASDVTTEFWLGIDGKDEIVLPQGAIINDVCLTAAGVDTSYCEIYLNSQRYGADLLGAANAAAVRTRQFMGAPIICPPGSVLRFKQIT